MIENMLNELFPKPLDTTINPDRCRIFNVVEKLLHAIICAESGEISYSDVFDGIPVRDCLSSNMVLATTWHIDDIRDRFPENTADSILKEALTAMEDSLSDVAVMAGWEVIADSIEAYLE